MTLRTISEMRTASRSISHLSVRGTLIAITTTVILGLGTPGLVSGQTATAVPVSTSPTTMTVAVENAPSDLDPASSYDENSNIPLRAAYEGLVTLKGDSLTDTVPVLAQSVDDQNNQHQVFTFKLQTGVKFHDGTDFNADAAKFGILRTINLALGPSAILGTFFTDAKGNIQTNNIQVVDPATLKVTFDRPQPFFLIALAASYGTGFVSPTAVKLHTVNGSDGKPDSAHTWLQTHEAGTGPYTLNTSTATAGEMPSADAMGSGTPMTMVQFPGYWRGWTGNHLSKIVIKVLPESGLRRQALEAGQIDAATVMLPQDVIKLQTEGGYQFNAKQTTPGHLTFNPMLRVDFLVMAAGYGPLKDVHARQAMAYAFDYGAYNRGELGGLGTQPNSPFPNTLFGWDNTLQPFQTDLKKAVQLLNQAGIKPGTTLTFAAQNGRGDIAGAVLKQQLEQIGLELQIKKYSDNDYNNLLTGDIAPDRPDFFLQTWWPDYNSPLNYSLPLFYSKSAGAAGQNAGYYADPQADAIITQAQQMSDTSALTASFKQFQKIVYQDDPAGIFMAQAPERTVVSAHIQGQIFNALYLGTFDFYALSKS